MRTERRPAMMVERQVVVPTPDVPGLPVPERMEPGMVGERQYPGTRLIMNEGTRYCGAVWNVAILLPVTERIGARPGDARCPMVDPAEPVKG